MNLLKIFSAYIFSFEFIHIVTVIGRKLFLTADRPPPQKKKQKKRLGDKATTCQSAEDPSDI